jgi:hypothetical protein
MGASPAQASPDPLDETYRRCMDPLLERARVWFPTLEGCEQDLYQAAWESLLASSRPIDDPETYLKCAVYSAGLKELRRRRRRPVVSLSAARFRNGVGGRGAWQQGVEALDERTAPLPEEQKAMIRTGDPRTDALQLRRAHRDLVYVRRIDADDPFWDFVRVLHDWDRRLRGSYSYCTRSA